MRIQASRTPGRAILLHAALAASWAAAIGQTSLIRPIDPLVASPLLVVARPLLATLTGSEPSTSIDAQALSLLPEAPAPPGDSTVMPAKPLEPLVAATVRIPVSIAQVVAPPSQKYIGPGEFAQRSSAGDKVRIGVRDAFSPFAAVGWLAASGYSQMENAPPNFGTDRGAYGQRLGAYAILDSSEGLFSDCVMSSVFREDPRYYILGPQHNFIVRLLYAGTRPLITRTDSGRASPNLGLLTGTFGGAALSNTYYPQANRSGVQTVKTFGGSLGGIALGFVVSEFYGDLVSIVHPHHN